MARPSKYNWKEIKKHYEAGKTQAEIVLEFECPKSSLSERIKKEGWTQNEQVKSYIKGSVEVSELKANLIEQDSRVVEIADKMVDDEIRRRGLIFDATEKIIQASSKLLQKNSKQVVIKVKEYSKAGGSSESLDTIEQELDPQDLKNLAETVDKASITLGVNQRHANSQVTVNNSNAQQNNIELNKEIITETLQAFEDEY